MGIQSIDAEDDQFAYRYDTQLLIDRRDKDLDEDEIADYITEHFEGNSLIAAGDEDLVKIHFHTNEPWKILEYCNSVGEIYDIVVEDMIRQANGLQGSGKEETEDGLQSFGTGTAGRRDPLAARFSCASGIIRKGVSHIPKNC